MTFRENDPSRPHGVRPGLITLRLTTADLPSTFLENGAMSPRSDQAKHRSFTAQCMAEILAEDDAADPATPGP